MHGDSDHSLLNSMEKIINIKIIVLESSESGIFGTGSVDVCKNDTIFDYVIVLRIITVFVSITPGIFRKSSIHLLISVMFGALTITQISYWPVIS